MHQRQGTMTSLERRRLIRELVEAANELDTLTGGAGDLHPDLASFSEIPDTLLVAAHEGVMREAACSRQELSLRADIEAYRASGKQEPAIEAALLERIRALETEQTQLATDSEAAALFESA